MREKGRLSPTLVLLSATIYGKGGRDSSELCITAQTNLQLSVDGLTVTALVFIQPRQSALPTRHEHLTTAGSESCESQCETTGRTIPSQGSTYIVCHHKSASFIQCMCPITELLW